MFLVKDPSIPGKKKSNKTNPPSYFCSAVCSLQGFKQAKS